MESYSAASQPGEWASEDAKCLAQWEKLCYKVEVPSERSWPLEVELDARATMWLITIIIFITITIIMLV